MMKRVLQLLNFEVRGINSAVYVLALFALLSSLLALLRDRLLAHTFGASTALDLYYAAFRIPDFVFVALGALVSVYVLIPELARRDRDSQYSYIDTIFLGFSILAVCVGAVAALIAPWLLSYLFPNFVDAGFLPTLVSLTRIMLLQPILLGFSNIFAAITQTKYRYTLYAASPLFYNFGIILGIAVLYPIWGLSGLAWGVVIGAGLHAGIQIPSIVQDGFFRKLPRFSEPRILFQTTSVSVPRALALSMNQVTFIGLTALAGTLAFGSISVFMFSFNLYSVPLAIIGASYSVAAFPALALALANGRQPEFIDSIATAARHIFFWSLPATALIIILRAHIVRVVLGSGSFDWTDTRLTAASLALLSLALVGQGLMLLLIRGYYAAGRTFTPFLVSCGIALGTIGLGGMLIRIMENAATLSFIQTLLRVEEIPGSDILALPIAYAVATLIGTVVLTFYFERRFKGFFAKISRSLAEGIVSAFAGGVAAYATLSLVGTLTLSSTLASVLTKGLAAGATGIIVAGIAYSLLGNREFAETALEIRGRLWRGFIKEEGGTEIVVSAEEAAELK
ncbi:MAG: lipid II flippase MurJ [bacterium]|nr:lipid II flippase MurJ [bacterium]